MRIKILYILSDINNAPAFNWIAKVLDKERFELRFLFLNPVPGHLENLIRHQGIPVSIVTLNGKLDYPKAWIKCYKIIKTIKPDIIHCHLFEANLIGLSAGKMAGIKRRIHTRHHGDLHHVCFPRGVWLDRLVNSLSTDIIAPSEVAKKVLLEMDKVDSDKVKLIHHGFDFSAFDNISKDRIQDVRVKIEVNENAGPVIGIISRWTEWKGVQYTIKAFRNFIKNRPNAILILANAGGDFQEEIWNLLNTLPKSSFRVVEFEQDVAALYKIFDVFVHVPVRETAEAFGQIYIEALLTGVPYVFTKSGIAGELEKLVDIKFIESPEPDSIQQMLESPSKLQLANGHLREFSIVRMVKQLEYLYHNP